MPEELTTEEDEGPKSAPAWMLTYGDSVTLLVTFFVLLLTFSTPDEEDYGQLVTGFRAGVAAHGFYRGVPPAGDLSPDQQRLRSSRLTLEGAEKPASQPEAALDELKHYHDDVDIAELPDLRGARVIRIPLVELFGTGTELTEEGQNVLDHVVKMTIARAYSIVVHVRAGKGLPVREKEARSALMAFRVVRYVRRAAGGACQDIGLSNNIELALPPLRENQCEIVMLEV